MEKPGVPLFLTPHRSAELLFRQKEERYVYSVECQRYSNISNFGAPLFLTPHRSAELLFGKKRSTLFISLIFNDIETKRNLVLLVRRGAVTK